ncbi:MAG: ROK family protein [Candidatus Chaera renei]|uniref:ROK family protein n=1 Tax=Candidatus Chaera renei TaxID=2506947 RepID=A0A4Q0AK96_9BACT|nr:MAG: ROK family protein [Candidatus Chaera renei]
MILTVDTGATKTLLAVFDDSGRPQNEYQFATPQDQNQYWQALQAAINDRFQPDGIRAIAVAVPGIVNQAGTVAWCGNLPWSDFELAELLRRQFGLPVVVANDANAAGLAEANAIEPVPALCLYLTVSTGIGSGIILSGRLPAELSGSEAGHMLLSKDDQLVSWESFASGRAIHEQFGRFAYEIESTEDWLKISENLSVGLLAILPVLQPDTVVLGGSIGEHFNKFGDALNGLINQKLPPHIKRPQILPTRYGKEAVLYGCYLYARNIQTD